ncbi:MerR family transcriptional regulator [Clostridium saccharobutylicum]|uniref:Multidrug-efflux transporter 1 regulator n=1 Tax=Clostridium saccharobutylicum TaxID=169679 RepID=A0A1S8NHS5_CLOSA|nr:MerR family transcriptional regulator [Clostridium saccharobutylicum]OOM15958.1 multidrug-efflux transporter 1 regulator [Clostridium saccharobutylicum]
MSKILFKAGEFAALCNVKKDTLFYYDELGLLKPEIVSKNGYRYYSAKQLATFNIIQSLKEVGTPLKEIKSYMEKQDTKNFLSILKRKQIQLKKEQKRLNQIDKLLKNTIATIEHAQSVNCGEVQIEYCTEEYYIVIEAPEVSYTDEKAFHMKMQEHISYCRKNYYYNEFPLGEIILFENLKRGIFERKYFCSKIDHKANSEYLFIKPAGTYAVLFHKGAYETLPHAYHKFKEYIEQNGYEIIGNAYEEDQLYFLSVSDPNQYLLKISIQIEK